METKFKLVTFTDQWLWPSASLLSRVVRWPWPLRWILSPLPRRLSDGCSNYALGFQFMPTDRERRLIQKHNFFGHIALKIDDADRALTLADVLGPEFVPVVYPSFRQLLRAEALVREVAILWEHHLAKMPDPS